MTMQQKQTLQLIITLGVLLPLLSLPVLGEARFASKQEMIKEAEDIAVVRIIKVEPCSVKGSPWWDWKSWSDWTYHQRATSEVAKTFKGTLPKEITMYGGEDFTCARVNFVPGRCLVFLRHDRNLLVGSNWHLYCAPN